VPDHYAIQPVKEHDYERFYAEEIAHRAALGYPPCGRLAVALVSAVDAAAAEAGAQRLAEVARATHRADDAPAGADAPPTGPPPFEVLGPAPAPLSRLRDRYRFHVLLRGASDDAVRHAARAVQREIAKLPAAVRASVDVSPMNML